MSIPEWIEANLRPSSTMFICPHCRKTVYFSHGSTRKSKPHGVLKQCLYRFCPWCGKEVAPLIKAIYLAEVRYE